jgi:hypothetical protein
MSSAGVAMFARYAYPPNELGYCGPDDASVLLHTSDPDADDRIAQHARRFDGAWTYLELIAAGAGIADPLDPRVVEAYWIGNDLLDDIDPALASVQLQERFPAQPGATWTPGYPHHGFQVFAVYPWARLLRRGVNTQVALAVLEQCRIRWGEVVAVEGARVRVRSRPLVLRNGRLELDEPRELGAAWSVAGTALLPAPVRVGEHVAMHWDWVCDVLDARQVAQLECRGADQLERTNAVFENASMST